MSLVRVDVWGFVWREEEGREGGRRVATRQVRLDRHAGKREGGREGRGEKIEGTTATEAATATGGCPIEEGVQNEKRG